MILIISGIAVIVGFIMLTASDDGTVESVGATLLVLGLFVGFMLAGFLFPVRTEQITLSKNDYSFSNVENRPVEMIVIRTIDGYDRIITDPLLVKNISEQDTVILEKEYNSYGMAYNTAIIIKKFGKQY